MTVFEYLSVFISIIIGLAVANILLGLSRILGQGEGTSIAHALWIYWTLLFLTFFWWFSFDWRLQDGWTFGLFLWVVGYAMLMFVLAMLVTPTSLPPDTNWGETFFSQRRTFFSVSAVVIVVDTIDTFVKGSDNLAVMNVPALLANQGVLRWRWACWRSQLIGDCSRASRLPSSSTRRWLFCDSRTCSAHENRNRVTSACRVPESDDCGLTT